MASATQAGYESLIAAADLSASIFRWVTLNSSGEAALATSAGERCFGVLQNKPTAGDTAAVAAVGNGCQSKVVLAEAVSAGDDVTTDAAGATILSDTTGHSSLGIALESGGIGAIVSIQLGTGTVGISL